jgi:hypothetical protein
MSNKEQEEALKKAVENTPKVFSANDICDLDDDDEDRMIYERRLHRDDKMWRESYTYRSCM